jgi:hypothetical protein
MAALLKTTQIQEPSSSTINMTLTTTGGATVTGGGGSGGSFGNSGGSGAAGLVRIWEYT